MDQDRIGFVLSAMGIKFRNKPVTNEDLAYFRTGKIISFKDLNVTEEEVDEAIRQYKINVGVKMETCEILTEHQDDHWFENFLQANGKLEHYERYKKYLLGKKVPQSVIETTEKNNRLTMQGFADPSCSENVQRKGLVVGDVQAGKTLNYIGLINMAVDVGYKNIFLLTGTTEELRKQTQRRIDEGFVGCYTESFSTNDIQYCGVGINEKKYYAFSKTSYSRDFSKKANDYNNSRLSDDNKKPNIFVLKKNSSVLQEVINLVSREDSQVLNRDSVLIIDDECDFASLNTRKDENPTAINKLIRELLGKYSKSTYVGYSATPFANIFVNPDLDYKEENGHVQYPDLFPSDFIVLLESPSNYIGAKDMFSGFETKEKDDGEIEYVGQATPYIRLIGDHFDNNGFKSLDNGFLPIKHKKNYDVNVLADSLKKAIKIFLLSSCVYTLRGHETDHRTMLVNVSRFNDIQEDICHQINNYLDQLRNAINCCVRMSDEYFDNDPMLNDLKKLWLEDNTFRRGIKDSRPAANKEFTFSDVKSKMKFEIDRIKTYITNMKHKGDRLDFDLYKGEGARGIVIGGFTLSRGLTLEGLMTSYYSRNSSAYDTLIQMGRWFGYRTDYEDLVNVYMTQSSIDQFCAASEATEDLKSQFRRMKAENKKPIDFGLMVREAPETLENVPLVTSANKMKNTKEYVFSVKLKGKPVFTSKILKSKKDNETNKKAILELFSAIFGTHLTYSSSNDCYYDSVSDEIICDFLNHIKVSPANTLFDTKSLIKFIRNTRELNTWYVIVAHGHKNTSLGKTPRDNGFPKPFKGACVKRSFELSPCFDEEDYFRVGGTNNQLIDPNILMKFLTEEQIREVRKEYLKGHPNTNENDIKPGARDWLGALTKPVLIIYPIDLKDMEKDENQKEVFSEKKRNIIDNITGGEIVYGFALGFPGKISQVLKMKYRINVIKQREIEQAENDIDEDMMEEAPKNED